MLSFLRTHAAAPGTVAVAVVRDGCAVAHVVPGAAGARLERCEWLSNDPGLTLPAQLRELVEREGLRGARCVFVVGAAEYALHVIDAPAVPEEELEGAARWSIRDLVDFEIDDAQVSVFESPGHRRQPAVSRCFVASVRESCVRWLAELARECELELIAIEIPELALRNLVAHGGRDQEGVALAALYAGAGLITISRGGYLSVARWFDADPEALAELSEKSLDELEPDALGREELEDLLLQIQRSLDYHEHELGQRAVASVAFTPLAGDTAPLRAYLSRNVDLPVRELELPVQLKVPEGLASENSFGSLLAIGACLRDEGAHPQQVNLIPSASIESTPLSPARMVQIVGGCAAALAIATLWLLGSSALRRGSLDALELEAKELTAEVSSLEFQSAEHLDPSAVEEFTEQLLRELQAKRRVIRWVTDPGLSNTAGFSSHLLGLSRRTVKGLWLRGFEFAAGGHRITFRGSALHPELIPRFLQELGAEASYRGKEFRSFFLQRSEQGAIDFEIGNPTDAEAS